MADTNIIISAVVFGGLPRRVIDLGAQGLFQICFSAPIREEVERVLEHKFAWERPEIDIRMRVLFSWMTQVHPERSLKVIKADPDDDRILECALAANADVIVSGDRHLLLLGSFQSIPIQTARQFLDNKDWVRGESHR